MVVVETIIGVIIAILVLYAGTLAVGFFTESMPTMNDPVANASLTQIIGIGFQSLNITGIAILISAVMAIIAVIIGTLYFRSQGSRGGR